MTDFVLYVEWNLQPDLMVPDQRLAATWLAQAALQKCYSSRVQRDNE